MRHLGHGEHPSWNRLDELITQFIEKYGGMIYDREAGRSWDPGQFACRLGYGPGWSTSQRFHADDAADGPVPGDVIQHMEDVLENGLPVWAEVHASVRRDND